jgi:hypothetical protein
LGSYLQEKVAVPISGKTTWGRDLEIPDMPGHSVLLAFDHPVFNTGII